MADARQYQLLLSLLRLRPERKENVPLDHVTTNDWNGMVDEAMRHGIAPLIYARLQAISSGSIVPAEVMEKLKGAYLFHGLKNTQRFHEFSTVLGSFQEEGISSIALKGAHLAESVYGNLALRPMDDLDLLVKKMDLALAEKKLLELGYVHPEHFKEGSKLGAHHLPSFAKPGGVAVIEVHWMIPPAEPFRIDVDGLWERARSAKIAGSETLVLSPEDLLLHLCLHASIHHRFGLGIRPLADIGETIHRYHGELDWEQFLRRSRQWHARNCVYLTLLLAKTLLEAAVPDEVLNALRPGDFDERLIVWANEQIAQRSSDLTDPSSVSPRIAQIMGRGSLSQKAALFFRVVFPPMEEMALLYHVPPRSGRIFFYYPIRLKDLIFLRGGTIWQVLRRDKTTIVKAEIYQKLLEG
ncbi:MAG TPA: hypothetical protein DGH68_04950 [Bacteroidetes bacterium]|nr:hypothetical protein [Bacteroidota bacterium]